MATLEKAPTSNFWSTSLNGAINDSVTTITLNSTTGLQAPGRLVINRQDSTGKNTPSAREVISFTGISGSDLTGVTRGADNSTARSHADGSLVESAIVVGNWDALYKVVNQEHSTSGVHSVADMVTGGSVIDDDTFATASATTLATSESIKAYADNSPSSIARQAIINGNFDVWQRGTSFIDPGNSYTADRFFFNNYGSGLHATISREEFSNDGSGLGSRYYLKLLQNSATASNHWLYYTLESNDTKKFQGKEVTVSFRYKIPTSFTNTVSFGAVSSTSEDTKSISNQTPITSVDLTNSTSWTTKTVTFTVPTNCLTLTLRWSTVTSTVNNAEFDLSQVMMNVGSVALPFMPKSFEEELRACQRYYETGKISQTVQQINANANYWAGVFIPFKVTKRTATPTLSTSNESWNRGDNFTSYSPTLTFENITAESAERRAAGTDLIAVGVYCSFVFKADAEL